MNDPIPTHHEVDGVRRAAYCSECGGPVDDAEFCLEECQEYA